MTRGQRTGFHDSEHNLQYRLWKSKVSRAISTQNKQTFQVILLINSIRHFHQKSPMIPMPVPACDLIQSASRMLMLAFRRWQQQQQQPVSGCRSSKQPEKELGLSKRRKKKPDDEYGRARAFACYIIRSISGKIECITPPEPEVQATGAEPRRGGRMCGGEDQNGVSRAPCLL